MHILKYGISTIAVFLLTACTTALPAKRIASAQLNVDAHALVAINMDTQLNGVVIELKCLARCASDIHLYPFAHGISHEFFEVPPGHYRLGKIYANGSGMEFRGGKPEYDIKPGQLNYLGDYSVYTRDVDEKGVFWYSWNNFRYEYENWLTRESIKIAGLPPVRFVMINNEKICAGCKQN